MNILLPILIITVAFHVVSPAPMDHLHQFELTMLNKLHKPWFSKPQEYPRKGEHPRKGEYPCKGGICKSKGVPDCEECQYQLPLRF
ncbi:uncharacterized protein LOC126911088 [Spodoptera frugiperda]|uniref:Uncharacterized protein LOC126911088 n=1 Tax=Spodoptera frugiperda TaxID=7108 RepID=A0A9R0EXU9_SPOFR|nr:uncharacterized protein LOC126911088 [Spodoptera frugiperda]